VGKILLGPFYILTIYYIIQYMKAYEITKLIAKQKSSGSVYSTVHK